MTNSTRSASELDRPQAIAAAIFLSCLGVLAIMLMPVLTAALVRIDIPADQAGYVTAAEALGTAVACLFATLWIQRVDWRVAAGFAIAVIVGGNLLSSVVEGFAPLLALRLAIGLFGGGTAFAVAMTVLGSTSQKDRNFAFAIAAQVMVGVLAFQLNITREIWGVPGVLVPVAVFAAIAILFLSWIPRGFSAPAAGHGGGGTGGAIPGTALMALAALLTWCTGLGAIWAFVQLIGEAAGIEAVRVGQALGITTLIGTSGALIAAWLAGRAGRLLPVTIALLAQVVMISLLRGEMPWLQFLVTAAIFQIFWNLNGPYMMGTVALADTSGRASVLIPAAQIGGFFLGPVLVGQFLTGASYDPANAVAATCCLLALVIFIPTALKLRQQEGVAAPAA